MTNMEFDLLWANLIERNTVKSIARKITYEIIKRLDNCGFYYRITYRVKEKASLRKKLKEKLQNNENYKLQDFIGIRIILFFADDVEIVSKYLLTDFERVKVKNKDTDNKEKKEEKPFAYRNNYTYRIPNAWLKEFEMSVRHPNIDSTFELQIRSMNSEAWQELDHDYIYKRKEVSDKESEKLFFDSIGHLYKGLEDNILSFYNSMAEIVKGRRDLESFVMYKFRIKIARLSQIKKMEQEYPGIDFIKLIDNATRNDILSLLCDSRFEKPIDIGDLLNCCLKLEGKQPIFDSNNSMQEIIRKVGKNIKNLNPKLGTVHDEFYDSYSKYRDEVEDFGILFEDDD